MAYPLKKPVNFKGTHRLCMDEGRTPDNDVCWLPHWHPKLPFAEEKSVYWLIMA